MFSRLMDTLVGINWGFDSSKMFNLKENAHPKTRYVDHFVIRVGHEKLYAILQNFYETHIKTGKFNYSNVIIKACFAAKYRDEHKSLFKKVIGNAQLKIISDYTIQKYISIDKKKKTIYLSCSSSRIISDFPEKEVSLYL